MKFIAETIFQKTAEVVGIVGIIAVVFAIGFPKRWRRVNMWWETTLRI
jgi:hypothetical protein